MTIGQDADDAPAVAPAGPGGGSRGVWNRRLGLRAEHAAAEQALVLVQAVNDALARLRRGNDPEALHDFRVALRRLRAWLRGFAPALAVRGGTLRRLRRLARLTNPARDTETILGWLMRVRTDTPVRDRRAIAALEVTLNKARETSMQELPEVAAVRWNRIVHRLRRELVDPQSPRGRKIPFAAAWVAAITEACAEADARRGACTREKEPRAVHRYRIALKRLRYLLEPLAAWQPEAQRAVSRLRRLQNEAGAIGDLEQVMAWLRRRVRELGTERAEAIFELWLAGEESVARRAGARARYRLAPPGALGRIVATELAARRAALFGAETGTRQPRYAGDVRRLVAALEAQDEARARGGLRTGPE